MIDVLIAGAGPVGLSLAAELMRWGVSFRIIDKKAEAEKYSKASNFWPRTQEVITAIGYGAKALEGSSKVTKAYIYAFGKMLGKLPWGPYPSPFPHVRSINQGAVERLIDEHLQAGGHTATERLTTILSLTQHSDHVEAVVQHEAHDGTKTTEVIQSRYLVGCDGIHSVVRGAVGIPLESKPLPNRALRQIDAKLHWSRPHDESMHFFTGQNRFCGVVSMPDGYHRMFLCQPDTEIPERKPTAEEMISALREISGDPTVEMTDPVWLSYGKFYYGVADTLRAKRVFIAGDAGHLTLPIGGQGMNTGIQDAFNLGWKLAMALHGTADESILESYSIERQAVKKELCKEQVENFGRLMHTNTVTKYAMLYFGPLIISRQKGVELRGRDETQLSINYPVSPLTVEALREDGVKAGDRAPDAMVVDMLTQRDTTLFPHLYQKQWTLLVFDNGTLDKAQRFLNDAQPTLKEYGISSALITSDAAQMAAIVERVHSWAYCGDYTNEAHGIYGIKQVTALLVRPDGYVGFRGAPESISSLKAYCAKFFRALLPTQNTTKNSATNTENGTATRSQAIA